MPKIKNIIIFIAIALAFFLIYYFFTKSPSEEANLVSVGTNTTLPNMDGSATSTNTSNKNSSIMKDFLSLFSNIKDIKLDDAIFSNPAFSSLHDSSIILIPDSTEGRQNPFAQFGNDVVPTPVSADNSKFISDTSTPIKP